MEQQGEKEGAFLLGPPTFADIGGGRFRCEVTGHELPAAARDDYGRSKACRLALIDSALAKKRPPLNLFKQCPLTKSNLVCKLTGDTINKSEEHIWKHINGRRFLNKLEQKEMEKLESPKNAEKSTKKSKKVKEPKKSKKVKEPKKSKKVKEPKSTKSAIEDDEMIKADENEELPHEKDSDLEEPDFWTPPNGERWDNDDGKDRWDSGSGSEDDHEQDGLAEVHSEPETNELAVRTKRMVIAVGPSSFASRKKKVKTSTSDSKQLC